jgi:hypothetical protein
MIASKNLLPDPTNNDLQFFRAGRSVRRKQQEWCHFEHASRSEGRRAQRAFCAFFASRSLLPGAPDGLAERDLCPIAGAMKFLFLFFHSPTKLLPCLSCRHALDCHA